MRAEPFEQRFWKYANKGEPDQCWLWTGGMGMGRWNGYGRLQVSGKARRAHRISWELHNGQIPDGALVCHRCDTPLCVNPNHLFLGTGKDNVQDMIYKGRKARTDGEHSYRAKLDWEKVRTIRHLYFAERRTQQEIGDFFGVSRENIGSICRWKLWKLPPEGYPRSAGEIAGAVA